MGHSRTLYRLLLRLIFVVLSGAVCCLGQESGGNEPLIRDARATASENKVENSARTPGSVLPFKARGQIRDETYRIGAEDTLLISVWQEPDLSTPVLVRPDGMITLPLVNDISAVGLTPKELQTVLASSLKEYINEPHVTVLVQGIQSRKFYLLGEVAHPGVFPLVGRQTVLRALLEAGGLTPFAKSESIYVLRQAAGQLQRIQFKYKKALQGGQDVELLAGDTIVVP